MLNIVYSGKSRPTAESLAQQNEHINISRTSTGDINWGRATANTQLNPDISTATNKRRMRELFVEHNVPAPRLMDVAQAMEAVLNGQTIIGRPDNHFKGRGFWKCRTVTDIKRAITGTRRKKAATHFIEYIDTPKEFRVHIFLGKSLRISEKAHTEFHKYTTIKPTIPTRHIREAAKQAVAATGLDFGAVDILANEDQAWVLEVNAAPGLGGSMPRVWADAFLKWKRGDWPS